jgi:hypothetical protein
MPAATSEAHLGGESTGGVAARDSSRTKLHVRSLEEPRPIEAAALGKGEEHAWIEHVLVLGLAQLHHRMD